MAVDPIRVRAEFPVLARPYRGRPLVYLDSAATSQKPAAVIDAMDRFYREQNSNVHRGAYRLSEEATAMFEGTRGKVAQFIGAPAPEGIVYTRNTTEAINLVAHAWGRKFLKEGDEILLSGLEHHSNLVPWHQLSKATGAKVRHIPVTDDGRLDLANLDLLLTPRTKIVSVAHVSNVLGTINPVAEITAAAKRAGALVLVDGAQAVPHMRLDVAAIGCDFYAFSGHKMCGPTGIGILWGRPELLDVMDPFLVGGETINEVHLDHSTFRPPPHRFEAGTPAIAEVAGLAAAIDWLTALGMDAVHEHELSITDYARRRLRDIPGIVLYGPSRNHAGVISFDVPGVHPHDLATCLDQDNVCIRAGHHCAQPLMRRLGTVATARASFYVYTPPSDIDALVASINKAREFFGCR